MNDFTEAIYALWDKLANFPIDQGDEALEHLLCSLCSIFGAHNALWSVLVRLPSPASGDALNGWRPRFVRLLRPLPPIAASVQEQFDALWAPSVDLSQILAVSGEEPFRTRLLFEALPPEWFDGPHYQLGLLDGKTEKAVAAILGQSPNTTHIHVKSIYAKFGVHNRAALTSLWLGRLPEAIRSNLD
jgi:hypothetical protein